MKQDNDDHQSQDKCSVQSNLLNRMSDNLIIPASLHCFSENSSYLHDEEQPQLIACTPINCTKSSGKMVMGFSGFDCTSITKIRVGLLYLGLTKLIVLQNKKTEKMNETSTVDLLTFFGLLERNGTSTSHRDAACSMLLSDDCKRKLSTVVLSTFHKFRVKGTCLW